MPETEVKSHMYTMTNNYTKPADALKQSQNSKNSGAVGYTTRGTAIVNSNTELGQNAFLNILPSKTTLGKSFSWFWWITSQTARRSLGTL